MGGVLIIYGNQIDTMMRHLIEESGTLKGLQEKRMLSNRIRFLNGWIGAVMILFRNRLPWTS